VTRKIKVTTTAEDLLITLAGTLPQYNRIQQAFASGEDAWTAGEHARVDLADSVKGLFEDSKFKTNIYEEVVN